MAPTSKESSDNIIALSNHDFFKNSQCPMRTGNVRCRNIPMCTRVHYGDQSAPEKAVKLRDQLLQHVKSLAAERSPPSSLVWNNIETKVAMLMDWVVCKKHVAQCETAVCMAMDFLKQDCGIFVEEESVQPGYLATPPPTPAAYFPSQAWQYAKQYPSVAQASVPIRKEPASGQMFGKPEPPQQSAFNFTVDKPMKTEPVTNFFAPQAQQFFHASPTPNASQKNTMNASSTQPQQVPFSFDVRTPTINRQAANTPSPKQPRAKSIEPQSSVGSTIRSSVIAPDPKSQPTKQQARFKFGVHPPTGEREGTAPQPAQSDTFKEKSPHFCDKCKMLQAQQEASDKTIRSLMDQLAKDKNALELSYKKLETLAADNKKLTEDNKRLEAMYHAADDQAGELELVNADLESRMNSADDRINELKDENETLQSRAKNAVDHIGDVEDENENFKPKLTTSEEVVERLEQELAALRKPCLSRLGVW